MRDMGKQSSTQVTVTVTGDGITSTYAPSPLINATASPSGGPSIVECVGGGVDTPIVIPTGAKGLVVNTSTANIVLRFSAGGDSPTLGVGTSMIAFDPTVHLAGATVYLRNNNPGAVNVFVQWV